MSSDHEMRLDREGSDNIENLSHARPIDLAVRTGFGYRQLKQWVGEARLRLHLENDFEEFVDRAGIRTVEELVNYWQGQPDAVAQHLKETVNPKIFAKLAIVVPLLLRAGRNHASMLPGWPFQSTDVHARRRRTAAKKQKAPACGRG